MKRSSNPKSRDERLADPSRRAMLRGLPAAGLAVGSLAIAQPAEAHAEKPGPDADGYEENDHIRRYYELNRF